MNWIVLALLSALSAGVTATLIKAGVEKVDSNLAMALQSVLILAVTWGVVLFQRKVGEIAKIDGRTWGFLVACGIITSVAYLFYFAALKAGESSRVAPVDRLSLVFAVILAAIFLKEKLTMQVGFGAALMAAGALVIALAKPSH